MFLTLCSHYTVPPWWKQSFHPCFECALHSKTDRFNCTHSYSARQCSDPCISEQSSALMNEASYCMYNIQHFISFRSSIATSKNLLSPARDRSRNSRIDPIRSRVSKPLDQPARFFLAVFFILAFCQMAVFYSGFLSYGVFLFWLFVIWLFLILAFCQMANSQMAFNQGSPLRNLKES